MCMGGEADPHTSSLGRATPGASRHTGPRSETPTARISASFRHQLLLPAAPPHCSQRSPAPIAAPPALCGNAAAAFPFIQSQLLTSTDLPMKPQRSPGDWAARWAARCSHTSRGGYHLPAFLQASNGKSTSSSSLNICSYIFFLKCPLCLTACEYSPRKGQRSIRGFRSDEPCASRDSFQANAAIPYWISGWGNGMDG